MPTHAALAGAPGAGTLDDAAIARAQAALDAITAFFDEAIQEDVAALAAARNALRSAAPTEEMIKTLLARAESLEVQGSLYGIPFVAALAASLVKLAASAPSPSALPLPLVDGHVDALKALVARGLHAGNAESAETVLLLRSGVRQALADWERA
jgi:hypothetical protein